MAMGFRPFLIGTVLVVLFAMSLIVFATQFIAVNNPSFTNSSSQNLTLVNTRLQTSLNDFSNLANSSQTTLASENPNPVAFLFLIIKSGFTIPITFLGLIGSMVVLVGQIIIPQLFGTAGSQPFTIVGNSIIGILIITSVVLIINYIRTGSSER